MREFRPLQTLDLENVKVFTEQYSVETIELCGRFEKYGLGNKKISKKDGDWFGSFYEGTLTGIFHFSNHKSFLCFYTDYDILKKVDLLKTIRQYRPQNLSGVSSCVEPIYDMLAKSIKNVQYMPGWQMILQDPLAVCEAAFPAVEIADARVYDLNKAVDFLLEVEKAFGKKPRMINDLKTKIMDREEQEMYLFLLHEGFPVAQGMVEFHTSHYAQVSSVYTRRVLRNKGFGQLLMREIVERIEKMGLTPSLIVEKKNNPAAKMYENLGFKKMVDYLVVNMEL